MHGKAITRAEFVASIPRDLASLEVGALDKPLLHPREYNNKILDVKDADALRKYYDGDRNVNAANIVDVDYIWSGQPYSELIPDRFDFVVSSHNIEHQPDLVRHLSDLSSVLKPDGRVYMIIPDHRYCFDAWKSASTIVDVLGAHLAGSRAPTPLSVLVNEVYNTHNSARHHWAGYHGNAIDLSNARALRTAFDKVKAKFASTSYVDAHVWTFTPKTLCEIMRVLFDMQMTDLRVEACSETRSNEFEFYVVLRKAGVSPHPTPVMGASPQSSPVMRKVTGMVGRQGKLL